MFRCYRQPLYKEKTLGADYCDTLLSHYNWLFLYISFRKVAIIGGINYMARYREVVCTNYVAFGQCKKGRDACHEHYCQKCDKYYPRAKVENTNRKKRASKNNQKLTDLKEFNKNVNY